MRGWRLYRFLIKVDLPNADPDRCLRQLKDLAGFTNDEVLRISAKSGDGVAELLEYVVGRVPPPSGLTDQALRALIFDSYYNTFRGVIIYIRLFAGKLSRGDKVILMNSERGYEVQEVGVFRPEMEAVERLSAGEVGYIVANIKEPADVLIGDTITTAANSCSEPLPGFKELRPMVFSGLYPINSADYEDMKTALIKLRLNDPSFVYQPENSQALGFGFRCGFLGLLHMDIINERLQREYGISLVMTTPSVVYQVSTTDGREMILDNPVLLPERNRITEVREPFIRAFYYHSE